MIEVKASIPTDAENFVDKIARLTTLATDAGEDFRVIHSEFVEASRAGDRSRMWDKMNQAQTAYEVWYSCCASLHALAEVK